MSRRRRRLLPAGLTPETSALLAAFTANPSGQNLRAYDRFYRTLKSGPISGSDILAKFTAVPLKYACMVAWAETEQQASVDLFNPTRTGWTNHGATHIPGVAWQTDDASGDEKWIDTGLNPVTMGLDQNAHSIFAWIERDTQVAASSFGWSDGTDALQVVSRNASNQMIVRLSQTTASVKTGHTHAFGFHAGNRSASNAVQAYSNMIAQTITNATQASVAFNNHNLHIGHPTATAYGADLVGCVGVGPSLTANEMRDLGNALAVLRMELMFTLDEDLNLTRVGESDPRYLMSTAVFQTFEMLMMESTDGKEWRLLGPNPVFDFGENFGASSWIRHGGHFCVVHANDPFGSPTNFTVVRTRDLINVEPVTHVDCSAVVGDTANSRVWAPKWFVEDDGTVHVLFSGSTNAGTGPFTSYEVHPLDNDNLAGAWSTPVAITGAGLPADHIDPFIFKEDDGTFRFWCKARPDMFVEYMTSATPFSGYVAGETGDWNLWGDTLEAPEEHRVAVERLLYLDYYEVNNRQMYYAVSDDDGDTYGALVELNTTIDIHHPSVLVPA